jgi:hypothetical protein
VLLAPTARKSFETKIVVHHLSLSYDGASVNQVVWKSMSLLGTASRAYLPNSVLLGIPYTDGRPPQLMPSEDLT